MFHARCRLANNRISCRDAVVDGVYVGLKFKNPRGESNHYYSKNKPVNTLYTWSYCQKRRLAFTKP